MSRRLVVATGAGAEMRRTLGVAVFSGMLGVTAFGLLLTPVFYYVIERFRDRPTGNARQARVERRKQPVATAVVEPLPKG